MADIIKNQIVNGLIPVSHNGRITACTSDGKAIDGIISFSSESDHREAVRLPYWQSRCRIVKITSP
ncbi:hypothetical protein DYB39_03980 [Providencia rettgeri]|nr:hypothetical protein DYB39_03620 [Providencia rettgeri]RFT12292.1 hypothetical protein DYB39_03980 [Providencia rettgeri]